jgi:uncharacterized protein involved in exopolysaccharide biosynthesis
MMEEEQVTEKSKVDLLELLLIFAKRKHMIFGGTMIFVVLTAVISFVVTPVYEATSRLMPPQQSSSSMAASLLGSLGGATGMLLGSAMGPSPSDLYVSLLQSQTVLDKIIARFDLIKLYDVDTRQDAEKYILDKVLKAEVDSKSAIISISVDDVNASRSAEMANAFVEELTNLLERIAVTDESKRRVFFERELKKTHETLSQSEDDLKLFQEATGVLKMDDQASAVLQGIANLKAQIASKEVQVVVMKTYASPQNPDLKKALAEINAMKVELKKLEEKQEQMGVEPLIPTGQLPALGTEYIRKLRDFRYNEALYEVLVKQYEASRLEEAKDSAIVQVIDKALTPEKKDKPRRLLMIVLAAIVGLFFHALIAYSLGFYERVAEQPGVKSRLPTINRWFKRF